MLRDSPDPVVGYVLVVEWLPRDNRETENERNIYMPARMRTTSTLHNLQSCRRASRVGKRRWVAVPHSWLSRRHYNIKRIRLMAKFSPVRFAGRMFFSFLFIFVVVVVEFCVGDSLCGLDPRSLRVLILYRRIVYRWVRSEFFEAKTIASLFCFSNCFHAFQLALQFMDAFSRVQ